MEPDSEPQFPKPSNARSKSKSGDAARAQGIERMKKMTSRERILLALDLGHRFKRAQDE